MKRRIPDDVIIAQCTPQGPGALALLRLSGSRADYLVDDFALLGSGKKLHNLPSHTIHHGFICNDEVLFFLMRSPRTFTGEDTVEITCHNNPYIIQAIIEKALHYGARIARPGEFTQRAFENGKIDLIKAEAIHDVITTRAPEVLKKSLEQLQGSLSSSLQSIKHDVHELLVWTEASFEFIDEEQRNLNFHHEILHRLHLLIDKVTDIHAGFSAHQHIMQGIRIALIGAVNVGKSTLFNAMIGRNRAIVSDMSGTTRDSIEALKEKSGMSWTFIDTAGFRTTDNVIEQEGIKRSHDEAQKADIILLVIDSSQPPSHEAKKEYQKIYDAYQEKTLVVTTKSDIKKCASLWLTNTIIPVSAEKKTGLDRLERDLEHKIAQLFTNLNAPFLLNQRQHALITKILSELKSLEPLVAHEHIESELIVYHLNLIIEHCSDLLGHSISEQTRDIIFRSFCVGK